MTMKILITLFAAGITVGVSTTAQAFCGFYVAKAAAQYFREQQSGAFVHFTSTSGLVGSLLVGL